MKINAVVIPIAALGIALGTFSSAAAQSGERRNRGSQSQGQDRSRGDSSARQRDSQSDRSGSSADRGVQRTDRSAQRVDRDSRDNRSQSQDRQRSYAPSRESSSRYSSRDNRGSREVGRSGYDRNRSYDRGSYGGSYNRGYGGGYNSGYNSGYGGGYSRGYYAPRLLRGRSPSRHFYGSGGRLSLYFGTGYGYLYGSRYSGRVYGYRGRSSNYDRDQYYGDVRLKVSPRDAAVYVDGYYAGIVDDFDGFLQRLTLEVGPHEIEIEAPGLESQVFDVYVDPSRTIDLHADLLR